MKKSLIIFAIIFIIAVSLFVRQQNQTSSLVPQTNSLIQQTSNPTETNGPKEVSKNRVTKKAFGIYSTPETSLVENDRFTGYHSGTDFEVFPEEENIDVQVKAVCTGNLILSRVADGYGGVVVQECKIDNQRVTVVYGHIKLSSVFPRNDQILQQGDLLGVLGKGFSQETDGERKHLHLGIHKGDGTDIAGYVSRPSDLANWHNPEELIKSGKIINPID